METTPLQTEMWVAHNVGLECATWNSKSLMFSKDYQHIEKMTNSGLSFFTQSDVSCCVYDVEMLESANPSLTSGFIHDLESLSEEYVAFIYRK